MLWLVSATLVGFVAWQGFGRRSRPRANAMDFVPRSEARVMHIVDGDTVYFELVDGGQLVKGRLAGINCPECKKREVRRASGFRSAVCVRDDEHFGMDAYQQLRRLLRGASIYLDCVRRRDGRCRTGRFGRILLEVTVGRTDVAAAMVARGAAWTFTRYPSRNRASLCRLEQQARRKRLGMWAAGSVDVVMARMHAKTRRWYAKHDQRCGYGERK